MSGATQKPDLVASKFKCLSKQDDSRSRIYSWTNPKTLSMLEKQVQHFFKQFHKNFYDDYCTYKNSAAEYEESEHANEKQLILSQRRLSLPDADALLFWIS